jgi:hypothetical protein
VFKHLLKVLSRAGSLSHTTPSLSRASAKQESQDIGCVARLLGMFAWPYIHYLT